MANKDVSVGMNIGGLSYYSSELKFVDIGKLSQSWITQRTSGPNANKWDTNEQNLVNWRNDGYPSSLPGIFSFICFPLIITKMSKSFNQRNEYIKVFHKLRHVSPIPEDFLPHMSRLS